IAPRIRHPRAEERALLDALATAHPRLLDDEEIGANALIVLFGGIETTEGLIANALWALLSHPEALRRARSGPADLARAIDESLRWEPAVQTVTRYAAHDARVGDTTIPRGAVVQCMLGALNRDPAHVREPDRFDPWREGTAAHLAFGAGRHVCLGAALARLEGQVALGRLLEAHPRLALDAERTRGPRGREFRKVEALVVRLEG
ncbi:MAG: cytochrome P450, partial [Gemmatimonadetes bacterium]|nr:cytochrome P450 [Gemmatimonadota bacterium]